MLIGIIIGVVVLALLGFGVVGFNKLRSLDVSVDEAVGGIDVQLTRRAELIPNLVNTVKGYAAHEASVLEEVTKARASVSQATQGGSIEAKAAADGMLTQALGKLMAVVEAYPDLKADVNFQQLQGELTNTENQLAFARQFYNDAASQLNQAVRTLPWLLFTGIAGVNKRDFYDAPVTNEAPPTVQF